MDINVFAKFYEFPSLPFQAIENQNVADGRMDVKTVYTPPPQTFVGGGWGGGIKTRAVQIYHFELLMLKVLVLIWCYAITMHLAQLELHILWKK